MLGYPIATPDMKIGLLGGSFDPAHAGHVHITLQAMRRFGLDQVWWLVSPGNPLKSEPPAPVTRRIAAARATMRHPHVIITDIETRLGTLYTADTLRKIRAIYPGVHFVWLMGADNLAQFDKWQQWNWIAKNFPIGVTSRPGEYVRATNSHFAQKYWQSRVRVAAAKSLPTRQSPAWCLLEGPVIDQSSSKIRARGEWTR